MTPRTTGSAQAYDLLLPPRRALLRRRVALEIDAEHDAIASHPLVSAPTIASGALGDEHSRAPAFSGSPSHRQEVITLRSASGSRTAAGESRS